MVVQIRHNVLLDRRKQNLKENFLKVILHLRIMWLKQILDFLKEMASSREKTYEKVQLHMQNQAKTLALKEMEAENKIMLKNLNSIDDNTRQFILSEQARIIQKKNSTTTNRRECLKFISRILCDFGGSRPNLP
ncbi:hypothetical protein YC2023_116145 [Brassica napus]